MSGSPILCIVAPTAVDRASLRLAPPATEAELWAVYDYRSEHAQEARPPMDRHVRVSDARRGSSLERVARSAARREAPWVGFWFPRSGQVPGHRVFQSVHENCREADVFVMPSPAGLCSLMAFRHAPAELLRELQWQSAPDAEDLRERALRLGLSCYRFPAV